MLTPAARPVRRPRSAPKPPPADLDDEEQRFMRAAIAQPDVRLGAAHD